MNGVANFSPDDAHPLIDLVDDGWRPRKIDADGDGNICEVIFREERWNDFALSLRCDFVAVD